MKELYRDAGEVSSGFSFDEKALAAFLQRMFEKKSLPDGIDPGMFREILRILNTAAKEGFGERNALDPDVDFYDALLRNNAVFAAFKVHRMQNDMAAMLHDELAKIPQITFTQKAESNQLFLTMPLEASKELHKQFEFFYWNESKGEIRFVTSFDTTKEDIDKLVAAIKSTLGHCK